MTSLLDLYLNISYEFMYNNLSTLIIVSTRFEVNYLGKLVLLLFSTYIDIGSTQFFFVYRNLFNETTRDQFRGRRNIQGFALIFEQSC